MLHVEGGMFAFADVWDYSPSCVPRHILEVELKIKVSMNTGQGLCHLKCSCYIFPVNGAICRACLEL